MSKKVTGKEKIIVMDYDNKDLTDEELKQWEEDALLDGKPGTIPNWSKHYKPQKKADK